MFLLDEVGISQNLIGEHTVPQYGAVPVVGQQIRGGDIVSDTMHCCVLPPCLSYSGKVHVTVDQFSAVIIIRVAKGDNAVQPTSFKRYLYRKLHFACTTQVSTICQEAYSTILAHAVADVDADNRVGRTVGTPFVDSSSVAVDIEAVNQSSASDRKVSSVLSWPNVSFRSCETKVGDGNLEHSR